LQAPAPPRGDNIPIALAAITAAVFALSLGDALVKRFNADFTLWQIFILRSALTLPPLIAYIKLRLPRGALPRHEMIWCAARGVLLAVMWLAYYAALPHLQLAPAAAMFYASPIFIVLFAALLIGGRIGARGWSAVALGFCGVLLILRPRAADFNAYALLPLLSAVLYACAMILARMRCRRAHPLTLALALHLAFLAIGLIGALLTAALPWPPAYALTQPFLFGEWAAMGAPQWGVMSILALAALIGSIGPAYAYQLAPPPVVAPFEFAYLAFSVLWGVTLFADAPGMAATLGIALITIAGLLAVRPRAAP